MQPVDRVARTTGIGATKSAVFVVDGACTKARHMRNFEREKKKEEEFEIFVWILRRWLKGVINTLPRTCITSTAKLCRQPVVYDRVALPPLPVIHFYIPGKLEKFQAAVHAWVCMCVCVCVCVSHATTCTVYHGQVNNNVTAVSPVRIMKRYDRSMAAWLSSRMARNQNAETEIENCDLWNAYDRLDTARYRGTVIVPVPCSAIALFRFRVVPYRMIAMLNVRMYRKEKFVHGYRRYHRWTLHLRFNENLHAAKLTLTLNFKVEEECFFFFRIVLYSSRLGRID